MILMRALRRDKQKPHLSYLRAQLALQNLQVVYSGEYLWLTDAKILYVQAKILYILNYFAMEICHVTVSSFGLALQVWYAVVCN